MAPRKRPHSPDTRSAAQRQRSRAQKQSGGFGSAARAASTTAASTSRATSGSSVTIRNREIVPTYKRVTAVVTETIHDLSDLDLGVVPKELVQDDHLHWLDESGADPFSDVMPDLPAPNVTKVTQTRRRKVYKVRGASDLARSLSDTRNAPGINGSLHDHWAIPPSQRVPSARWPASPGQRGMLGMQFKSHHVPVHNVFPCSGTLSHMYPQETYRETVLRATGTCCDGYMIYLTHVC
jgi:hypothetical protein